ncbi:MAG: sensor histidine kinase [Cyclobacteriaceae bacterium]|jgi:signal transduction histidine kinase|nr:HAMP domain-containing histidine kinase [Flammeovirgaceae bacterium]
MNFPIVLLISLLVIAIAWLGHTIIKLKAKNRIITLQGNEIERQLLELNKKSEELKEIVHQNQQIISLVSHDLKGPFNRIFALVQLLNLTSQNLSDEQREYMDKIHQIVADGLGMMRNLLDNRKLEDKGITILHEKLNLSSLLQTLVKNYEILASKKKIAIHYQSDATVMLESDKSYLNRIFENLLSNALKFSESGKNIYVSLSERASGIEVSVRDEGPGIPPEDQLKLYHKFQRLTARPTAGESSTGLGLWIVKSVVEKLEGTIDCESEEGVGSTFTVRLKRTN